MNKKILFVLSFLSTITLNYGINGELKTSGKIDFTSKSNEKEKTFSFYKSSYDLTLIDLKLKDNKYGFDFGTILKSSRNNILLNDNNNENIDKINKSLDHDIQAKFFVNYGQTFDKLSLKTGIEYYLENFFIKKVRDESGNILKEDRANYEFIDGDKKYTGGDIKINLLLDYNILNDIKFKFLTEYYANKFVDFNQGYPYYKFNTGIEAKDYSVMYNFNLNLRSLFKPYVEEKENEDDENYAFLDNYVKRYRQQLEAKYNKGIVKANVILKDYGYLIGGNKKTDPIQINNHRIFLDTNLSVENKIDKLTITNLFKTENKFETVKYMYTKKYELWSLIKPEYELSIKYDEKISDFNISPNFKYKVELLLPLTEKIFDVEYLVNKHRLDTNLATSYEKNNIKANLNFDNNVTFSMRKDILAKIEANFKQEFLTEYKYNDKLKFEGKFSNESSLSTINDVQERIYLDNSKNKNELSLKANYNILKGLDFSSKLSAQYEIENNHILNGGNIKYVPFEKYQEEKKNDKVEKPNIVFSESNDDSSKEKEILKKELDFDKLYSKDFTNEKNRILFIQKYINESEITYKKEFDKLLLISGLKVESEIDSIALTKEKITKERNQDEDLEEMRIPLEASTPEKIINNIGGKVNIVPQVKLKYDFTDKLNLETGMSLNILFAKKVINQINDNKRTDDGLYGPMDKEFKLRKITPEFNISLNYAW